jgi:hypothetical protein
MLRPWPRLAGRPPPAAPPPCRPTRACRGGNMASLQRRASRQTTWGAVRTLESECITCATPFIACSQSLCRSSASTSMDARNAALVASSFAARLDWLCPGSKLRGSAGLAWPGAKCPAGCRAGGSRAPPGCGLLPQLARCQLPSRCSPLARLICGPGRGATSALPLPLPPLATVEEGKVPRWACRPAMCTLAQ